MAPIVAKKPRGAAAGALPGFLLRLGAHKEAPADGSAGAFFFFFFIILVCRAVPPRFGAQVSAGTVAWAFSFSVTKESA
jgi:hypothetical protein